MYSITSNLKFSKSLNLKLNLNSYSRLVSQIRRSLLRLLRLKANSKMLFLAYRKALLIAPSYLSVFKDFSTLQKMLLLITLPVAIL